MTELKVVQLSPNCFVFFVENAHSFPCPAWEREQVHPMIVREKSSNGLSSTVTKVLPGNTPNRESNFASFDCMCVVF